jgi:hypothetical protein
MYNRDLIIFPAAALVLLVVIVSFRFLFLSIQAARNPGSGAGKNQLAMNNISNLFEMPVLFYVCVVLVYASNSVDAYYLAAAWLYVLMRYVHSYIHTTYNYVPHRLRAFLISNVIILFMWGRLVVQTFGRI